MLAAAVLALAAGQVTASHDDPNRPNDPLYGLQWGPQQVRIEPAWDRTRGSDTAVAIVDSGIDLGHEDLAGNTVPGNTFLDCGDRGCGDGDWQSGDQDGDPHGTHVAGIAGAVTDNGTGVVGVAPDTKLMAVRVLDATGTGLAEDVARGIRYAADNGADVVNLSLGLPPALGQALVITGDLADVREAIDYAIDEGVTVVAAAGNESFPVCDEPAFARGVICVGATSHQETQASYSNFPLNPDLDAVSAPGGEFTTLLACGEGILSTVPPGEGDDDCGYPDNRAYGEFLWVGTSMAAPHVSGVAALLAAQGCEREQIHELFRTTSRQGNTNTRGVYTPLYGFGIVDAAAATEAATALCAGSGGGNPGKGNGGRGNAGRGDGGGDAPGRSERGRQREPGRGPAHS